MKPILYSTPMVQSILEGRKTKTRRTKGLEEINLNPDSFIWLDEYPQIDIPREAILFDDKFYYAFTGAHNNSFLNVITCPYGKVGDVLWVRETWQYVDIENDYSGFAYKASVGLDWEMSNEEWKWRPSIFMPKSACRLFLEITEVRVERLQNITPNEACDEGIEYWNIDTNAFEGGELVADYKNYTWTEKNEHDQNYQDRFFPSFANAIDSFRTLWQKINGTGSWQSNPFVWVISFKQIKL